MMEAVIIIPCYNEAERLKLSEFSVFLTAHPEIMLLFVDDGSSDGTAVVLEKLSAEYANANTLILNNNRGKGEAVRQGMLSALSMKDVSFVGFLDADLATPLEETVQMLSVIKKGKSYISGCRLKRLGSTINRHWYRHLLGRVFATAASMHLKLSVYDTQCGAKIFAKELIPVLFNRAFVTKWFFDVEILRRMVTANGKQWVLEQSIEYPLLLWRDKKGSKIRYFSVLKDFIKLIFSRN